jgi:hypothetical protein
MTDDLPTARTTLRGGYVRVLVFCKSCRHQADADLSAIMDAGRGDLPLTELRFRCSQCRTRPARLRGDLAGQPAAVVSAAAHNGLRSMRRITTLAASHAFRGPALGLSTPSSVPMLSRMLVVSDAEAAAIRAVFEQRQNVR